MKIVPRGEWLVVEPIDDSKSGALYIPESASRQFARGKIVALGGKVNDPEQVGEGLHLRPSSVGDVIAYDRLGLVELIIGGQKFHMLKAREILATVLE